MCDNKEGLGGRMYAREGGGKCVCGAVVAHVAPHMAADRERQRDDAVCEPPNKRQRHEAGQQP